MPSPAGTLQVTVVVPTWNRGHRLVGVLDSLYEQTLDLSDFEVVVVDDGSDDDTEDIVERYSMAKAKVARGTGAPPTTTTAPPGTPPPS